MKKFFFFFSFFLFFVILQASSVKCKKKENSIICTYFLDRSDSSNNIKLKFHWISPQTPKDDRIRYVIIPQDYGSAYDYRFIPGRIKGKWKVVVTRTDTNKTSSTTFDINESEDYFFND